MEEGWGKWPLVATDDGYARMTVSEVEEVGSGQR